MKRFIETMKRFISILLVSVMLFGAVSCTSSKKTSEPTGSDNVTTPEATTPEQTTPEQTTPEQTTPEQTTPEQTTPEQTTPEQTTSGIIIDPSFDAVVYDFVDNFKNLEGTNFSLKMGHPVHGMVSVTTKWYNGDNEKVKCVATGKPLVGYWSGNSDGYHVDVCLIGDDIVWYPGVQLYNIIAFTAPEDGTYSYDFRTHSYWGCTNSSTKYRVEVNGTVHDGNEVTHPKGTTAEGSETIFTGTVSLYKGETIHFVYDPESDVSSDNSQIDKAQVTYISDKMADIPVFVPEKPNNPIVDFKYEEELSPIWTGNTVYDETVMFVGKNDVAPLFYPATEIISITNFLGTKTYVEGVDYVLENGMLKMPEGSSLIYCPENVYWSKHTYDVQTYKDGVLTPTMAGPGDTMHKYQVKVTYKHQSSASVTVEDKSETFKHVIEKLEKGEDVTILFFGDSITEGWDSSLKSGLAPHLPPWTALVVQYLANKYEYQINYVKQDTTKVTGAWNYPKNYQVSFGNRGTIHYINTGVGGYNVTDAVNKVKTHVKDQIDRYGCDILFYAFGMNNSSTNISLFSSKVRNFVDIVHEHSPETSIVLVSSMLPNSEQASMGSVPDQEEALEIIVENLKNANINNVELAPVQRVHKALDAVKRYRDTSGNNMNHPGDYLHRIYAQVALETICGYSEDYK
jgi:hypothetical protein